MSSHDIELIVIAVVASGLLRALWPSRNTGVDEARLARLELKISRIFDHLGLDHETIPAGVQRPMIAQAGVQELIQSGKKIQAIKLYREQTGLGLKDAKDAVEQIEAQLKAEG